MSNFGTGGGGGLPRGISLVNTVHPDVAPCLPSPSLPVFCGALDQFIRLIDDPTGSMRRSNRNDVADHARKISKLLQATDVTYLDLRTEVIQPPYGHEEHIDLYNEVLRCNSEAFERIAPVIHELIEAGKRLLPPPSSCLELLNVLELAQELPINSSSPKSGLTSCVHGYNVNQNIAPILEAIFTKHGDIAAECVFKASSVRAYFLEVVCEIVRRIQTHKGKIVISQMEEIKNQMLDVETANVNVSWLQAHLEGFYKIKEVEEKKSLLMEVKKNIISVKNSAEMELKERYMEMVTALKRFKKGEKCMKVLDLVEKNVNNKISEYKSVEDSWMTTINLIG